MFLLLVKPFSIWLYRKFTYYATYINWGLLAFVPEWYSGSTCTIYTDDETWAKFGKEHAVLIFNHSCDVDWVFVLFMAEICRILGNSKAFVKSSLKWVPIVGWTAQFCESIYVERNWDLDKINIEKQVKKLGSFSDPVWVTIFAEGTRFTPAKHAASVEFAKKSGRQPLQHLLLPRTRGFVLTAEQLRGKFPAVYSCTMAFDTSNGIPSVKNMLFGRPAKCDVFVERIPLDDVPEDAEKAADWLHECFRQKDKLIDIYLKDGKFPDTWSSPYISGPIRSHYRPRRLYLLLVTLVSSYFTLPLVARGIYSLLTSGVYSITLVAIIVALVYFALQKMLELSTVSKGSSYGSDSPTKEAKDA